MSESRGVAIVTGASRGIGAATARALGARGYAVAVNFANDARAAAGVVADVCGAGSRAIAVQVDVAHEDQILAMFERVDSELGPVTVLVNNAAITGGFSRVEDLESATLARVLAVNVQGSILCAREAVRRMSTRRGGAGGSIVNITSTAARIGSAGEWVHYAASKGAMNTFTIGLAREAADEGIRVNAVAPGLILTDLHTANGEPGRPERYRTRIPMQRCGTPEEVAEGVLWLVSDAARYVTGTILEVGGGL